MMLMAMKQASGRPWGDHGLFLRYHIEAVTIKGVNSFRQYKTDVNTIGRSAQVLIGTVKLRLCLERLLHVKLNPNSSVCCLSLGCWKECSGS